MCGIVGFSGPYPVDRTKFRWLTTLNENRGKDSTGVYAIKGDKKLTKTLAKDTLIANKFILEDEFNHAIDGAIALLGHTRAATQGAVTVDNTHPFEYDLGLKVVGVHNGFIMGQLLGKYLKDYGLEDMFNEHTMCDSQLIFAMLSKFDGDWNKLSEIEGGVTTVFTYPTKFDRTLFAYKREARTLHYGYCAEGIYISSEAEPLRQIGCFNVTPFEDNSLTVIKDGVIMDFQKLSKPKILVPIGSTEKTWSNFASKEELEVYPQLKILKSYVPVKTWKTPIGYHEDETAYATHKKVSSEDDKFKMLIRDVIEEVKEITDIIKLDKLPSSECTVDDMMDCVVVMKLVDSVKHNPLPGWSIYDKDDASIAGITMLNGVTLLHYPWKDILNDFRILSIYDPIDGKSVYNYTVKPKTSRILEVVLEIPFPQGEETKTSGASTASFIGGGNVCSNDNGNTGQSGNVSDTSKQVSLFPNNRQFGKGIQEQKKQIYLGREEGKVSVVTQCDRKKTDDEKRSEFLRKRRNLTYDKKFLGTLFKKLVASRRVEYYKQIKPELEKLQQSRDYQESYLTIKYYLDELIDVEDLLVDAALLRLDDIKREAHGYFVKSYAILLLTEDMISYYIGKSIASDRVKIDGVLDKYSLKNLAIPSKNDLII